MSDGTLNTEDLRLSVAVTLKEHEMKIEEVRKEVQGVHTKVDDIYRMMQESQRKNDAILAELTKDLHSRRAIKDLVFKLPTLAVIIAFIVYAAILFTPAKFDINHQAVPIISREEPKEGGNSLPIQGTAPH